MKQLTRCHTLLLIALAAYAHRAVAEDAIETYRELKETEYIEAVQVSGDRSVEIAGSPKTLDEYITFALLSNPGLHTSFTAWKAAIESVARVHSLPNPQISYVYYIRKVETRVGPQRNRLELSQMFPWFGVLDLRSEINLEESRILWERFRDAKLALIHNVKTAYYDLYLLERRREIIQENMVLLSALERVARSGYIAGDIDHNKLIRFQVELGRLEERLLSIEDRKKPLVSKLNSLLHRPLVVEVSLPDDLPLTSLEITDDELTDLLQERSPQLASIEHLQSKAKRARVLADKESMPSFGFGISYIETGGTDMPGVSDSGKDPLMAMMTVSLPLWREKYDAQKRQADLQSRAASEQREQHVDNLLAELELTLYRYRDAIRKTELYRDSLIPKANQSFEVTSSAFTGGTAGFSDLVDTQRTLLEFQLSYEEALVDQAKALSALERLTGGELVRTTTNAD